MFDFSFGELSLVIVIALIIIGPKQLPAVAQRLGLWLRQWRALTASMQNELQKQQRQQQLTDNEARAQAADKIRGDTNV